MASSPATTHWPLGEGWALLLGGSLLAVIGAALQLRWPAAIGAGATLVAAASPYLGMGTENALADTPSFFQGYSLDIGAASLLPTLLLVAGALSMPRRSPGPLRMALARLAAGLAPAFVSLLALLPAPHPEPTYMHLVRPGHETTIVAGQAYPWPWIWPSRTLVAVLGIALAAAILVTWWRARRHPGGALASGLVVASVAIPLVWVAIRSEYIPVPYWAYNGAYPYLLAVLPLLFSLVLARRAGRIAT